ncbi:isthmin-2-like [Penaeus chinensis]|uniref:isthmin-2-like n=1 Tax=Penaeus chinensis TaxID=139456 RepID=UPI001FB83FAB|nr:isthmin-2-like [Penaeus chinensis]
MKSGCACAMVLGALLLVLGLTWAPTVTPITSPLPSLMPSPTDTPTKDAHAHRQLPVPASPGLRLPDAASLWPEVGLEARQLSLNLRTSNSFLKRRSLEEGVTSAAGTPGGPTSIESPAEGTSCATPAAFRWCKVALRSTRAVRKTQGDPMHLKGSEKRRRKRKKKKQKRKRRKKRKKKRKRKRHGDEKTRSRPRSRSAPPPSLAPLRSDGVKGQGVGGLLQAVRGERERGPGRQSTRQEQPKQNVRAEGLPQVPSLLLPLEVIDSRTLARLRYNPSIRVSIQVVDAEPQEDEVEPAENPGEEGSEGGHVVPPRWPGEDANRITELFTHEEKLRNAAHSPSPTISRPSSSHETEEQDEDLEEQQKEEKNEEDEEEEEEEEEEALLEEKGKLDPLQKHAPRPSFSAPSSGTWHNRKRFRWKKKKKKKKKEKEKEQSRKRNRSDGGDTGRGGMDAEKGREREGGLVKKEEEEEEEEDAADYEDADARDGVRVEGADEEELRSTRELVVGLADALEELLKSGFKGAEDNEEDVVEDICGAWTVCRVERALQELAQLHALPSCPCVYPADLVYRDAIHDPLLNATFRWLAVSKTREKIDVYHRGADLCIRSLLLPRPRSLAAQTCCYSRDRHLLTRGSGAGSPALVSPEVNAALHRKVDILPWLVCRGNFLRYQAVRPPNNGRHCYTNPDDAVYQQQIYMATDY